MISEKDDLRHQATPQENYSESKWFSFYDETHDFWVSSRIGLEPNRKRANRWLVIVLGGKVICHDLAMGLDLPREDWNGISVGGLQYCTLEAMAAYGIKFSLDDIAVDVSWYSVTPVFDYNDCLAPLPPSLAAMHYEQSGKVRGTLSVAGKSYTINGSGHRDHSWGVRHWEGFHSWTALMGQVDGFYFHVEQFHEETSGLSRHGFVFANGENVPIRDASIEPEYSGDETFPRHFYLEIDDARGNTYCIDGEVRLTCPLNFGNCRVGESFGSFSSGGDTKAGIIEYGFTR